MSEGKYEVTVRPEKAAVVEEMKEQLSSQGVVLVAYNKLDVKTAMQLRRSPHLIDQQPVFVPISLISNFELICPFFDRSFQLRAILQLGIFE